MQNDFLFVGQAAQLYYFITTALNEIKMNILKRIKKFPMENLVESISFIILSFDIWSHKWICSFWLG